MVPVPARLPGVSSADQHRSASTPAVAGDVEALVHAATSPEDVVEERERREYLISAISELPERMRLVIEEYFFAERSTVDIAAGLGISESRASQLRSDALATLRDALNHAFDPERVTSLRRPHGLAAQRRDAYFASVDARMAARRRSDVPAHDPARNTAQDPALPPAQRPAV